MDSKAFIETGVLESYALGMCSEAEAREVLAMCERFPEVKAELEAIEASVLQYAQAHARQPKADTREKLFAEIEADVAASQSVKPTIPLFSSRIAVAASLLLFSLSLLGNIFFYTRWKQADQEVIALNQEKQQLADNMNANQVKMENMSGEMAVLTDPNTEKIMMKGVAASPNSMAMIYWNKQSKEVFIELKSLPTPEPGKQYQLWAIVEGKPVDAGMISIDDGDSLLHRMKDFESAQAFAITLEKEGGSPTPTLEAMVVMGAVES